MTWDELLSAISWHAFEHRQLDAAAKAAIKCGRRCREDSETALATQSAYLLAGPEEALRQLQACLVGYTDS